MNKTRILLTLAVSTFFLIFISCSQSTSSKPSSATTSDDTSTSDTDNTSTSTPGTNTNSALSSSAQNISLQAVSGGIRITLTKTSSWVFNNTHKVECENNHIAIDYSAESFSGNTATLMFPFTTSGTAYTFKLSQTGISEQRVQITATDGIGNPLKQKYDNLRTEAFYDATNQILYANFSFSGADYLDDVLEYSNISILDPAISLHGYFGNGWSHSAWSGCNTYYIYEDQYNLNHGRYNNTTDSAGFLNQAEGVYIPLFWGTVNNERLTQYDYKIFSTAELTFKLEGYTPGTKFIMPMHVSDIKDYVANCSSPYSSNMPTLPSSSDFTVAATSVSLSDGNWYLIVTAEDRIAKSDNTAINNADPYTYIEEHAILSNYIYGITASGGSYTLTDIIQIETKTEASPYYSLTYWVRNGTACTADAEGIDFDTMFTRIIEEYDASSKYELKKNSNNEYKATRKHDGSLSTDSSDINYLIKH